jgi:hypothetical protein
MHIDEAVGAGNGGEDIVAVIEDEDGQGYHHHITLLI